MVRFDLDPPPSAHRAPRGPSLTLALVAVSLGLGLGAGFWLGRLTARPPAASPMDADRQPHRCFADRLEQPPRRCADALIAQQQIQMNVRKSRQPFGFGHHAQVWRKHLDQTDRDPEPGPQSSA